jgi:hypothetical protein
MVKVDEQVKDDKYLGDPLSMIIFVAVMRVTRPEC